MPVKSIIKKAFSTSVKPLTGLSKAKAQHKVSFPKHISEVIGYGGEWSDDSFDGADNDNDDDDDEDDHDFMNLSNEGNAMDDNAANSTDDEASLELKRITRANTDFNMNNGNLLGDAEENIKRSFAALKLGAPQVDKEGKKQTLKINVVPFGTNTTQADVQLTTAAKAKFVTKTSDNKEKQNQTKTIINATNKIQIIQNDGKNSPPMERAMEKSLLDEISETLEQKQQEKEKEKAGNNAKKVHDVKIKFEIKSLSDALDEQKKPFLELKKPLLRNTPISKEQSKPKVNVFHKINLQTCDSDSNCSDENVVSAYYDVVEAQQCYENLPDGKCVETKENTNKMEDKTVYSSSQYITDMLLSSRTRAASYNLHEGNFMTSKITADGLIVTKCNAASDDALDSTGSSFDGSSDEEASYNMTRSESDSGIGISLNSHDYKNIATDKERQLIDKKLSGSNNSSDYEDIQVNDQPPVLLKHTPNANTSKNSFSLEKSRELHGEPDGSADPDGAASTLEQQPAPAAQQLPALPKSPPPTKIIDARPSFLHGLQKQQPPMLLKKPDLPAKPALVSPVNSPMKTFAVKRQAAATNEQRHEVISQLQMMMSKPKEQLNNETTSAESAAINVKDDSKLKKGKAPNPPSPILSSAPLTAPAINDKQVNSAPPTPERDYSIIEDFILAERAQEQQEKLSASVAKLEVKLKLPCTVETQQVSQAAVAINKVDQHHLKVGTVKEKEKEKRTSVNPKFRSLNTFVTQRQNAAKNLQVQSSTGNAAELTPELKPRKANNNNKCLSMSEECLMGNEKSSALSNSPMENMATTSNTQEKSVGVTAPQIKMKTKFSIKKFLRMGTSKTTDNLHKKAEGIYSEICTGEEVGVTGKPRLVIIHPLDMNTTAVEVVKDITKTSDAVSTQTVAVVTSKPPAPPLRATEGQRSYELNKPARPPPPKSAELRRKQQKCDTATPNTTASKEIIPRANGVNENPNGTLKSKPDNVYANLGGYISTLFLSQFRFEVFRLKTSRRATF